jgi:hypothetical protein
MRVSYLGKNLLDGPEVVSLLGQDVLHVEELAARLQHTLDFLHQEDSCQTRLQCRVEKSIIIFVEILAFSRKFDCKN